MKIYYEQSRFSVVFKYGGYSHFIYIVRIADRNLVYPIYTLAGIIEYMKSRKTSIRYWDIKNIPNRMPIYNLVSEYYALNGYLYLNRNQFNTKPMITEIK